MLCMLIERVSSSLRLTQAQHDVPSAALTKVIRLRAETKAAMKVLLPSRWVVVKSL